MIDIDNYKRALEWLSRCIDEQALLPQSHLLHMSVMQSFGVTYNMTEEILRESLAVLAPDNTPCHISSRELMRYAMDEGIAVCSTLTWLEYGLALERAHESFGNSFMRDLAPIQQQYLLDLQAIGTTLESRLVLVA